MKKAELKKFKLLYGIREGNKSFKLFMKTDDSYFVVKKQYILGILRRKEMLYFKSIIEAQDYIIRNTNSLHSVYIE